MDSTWTTAFESLITNDLFNKLAGTAFGTPIAQVAGYQWLSYIGALSAFFFSVAAAYNTGAIGVNAFEADFFAFIDEYQGDSSAKYLETMNEDELSTAL